MKFTKRKTLVIVIATIIAILNITLVNVHDSQVSPEERLELEGLEQLIMKEFNNDQINGISTRKYSGIGNYKLFNTTNNQSYFPILLDEQSNSDDYNLFESGVIINKKSGQLSSTLITLNGEIHEIEFRDPKEQKDLLTTYVFIAGYSFLILVLVFLPNLIFDHKKNSV